MKTRSFQKSSLLFRVANTYGNLKDWETHTDICRFSRAFLIGLLWIVLTIALCSVLSSAFVLFWVWVVVVLTNGIPLFEMPELPFMGFLMVVAFVMIALWVAFEEFHKWGKAKWPPKEDVGSKEPSLVSSMIESVKSKICFPIEFK
jgi:hypothetical protein